MRYLVTLAVLFIMLVSPLPSKSGQTTPTKPRSATKTTPQPPLPPVDLPTDPGLYAIIYTSMGNIVCVLYENSAPKTVANFTGLAAGTKAWKDIKTGRLTHKPLYPGTTFHRVIPGFMIQGGDPQGDGSGDPGYTVPDEIDSKLDFNQKGVLAMANSGPDTNGCQFFITVAPAPHLNGHYSIFGRVVSGQEIADAISNVARNADDKPDNPIIIKAITIKSVKAAKPLAKPNA